MTTIILGTKINWESMILKVMIEMLQNKSTGFAIQIKKLLQNAAFSFAATSMAPLLA